MIYFASDVHLGYYSREKDKARETLFINFLKEIRHDCTELFLLGDIFDYWFDYKKVIPRDFYRVLAELHKFIDDGIPITYLMGNHDFGHYTFFKEEFGIEVHGGDLVREINGKRFFLAHGDGKIPNDHGYNILKKILRNKFNQFLYRQLHPDLAIHFASGSSKKSRAYTSKKQYAVHDGMKKYAFDKIEEGFDYVVFGHRHVAEISKHKQGQYINLGDWLYNFSYAVYDGKEMKIKRYKKENESI